MPNLTISHRVQLDRSGPRGACAWCGKDTDVWAITPFRPDIGRVPLHLFCGIDLRDAYKAFQAGHALDADAMVGIARLAALPSGGQT